MEALNTAQHKAAEAMYKRGAAAAGGAGWPAARLRRRRRPGASGSGRRTGDVIDAEVVEEEKK